MDPLLLIYGTRRYRSAGDPSIATGRVVVTTADLPLFTTMAASLRGDDGGTLVLPVERGNAAGSVPVGRYTLTVSLTGVRVESGVENPTSGRETPTRTATFTIPIVVAAGGEHQFVATTSGVSPTLWIASSETIGPNPANLAPPCPDGGSRTPWGACVSPTSSLQDAQRQAESAVQSATALAAPHAAAEAPRLVLPSGVGRIFVRGIPDGMRAAIVRGASETALERIPDGSMVANVPSGSATLAVWRETFVVPRMVRSDEHSFPVSIGDGYNTTYGYSPTGLTLVGQELSYGRSAVSKGRVVAGIAVLAGAIALGYYGSKYVG